MGRAGRAVFPYNVFSEVSLNWAKWVNRGQGREGGNPKSEIRNPKVRNPKTEDGNPKTEGRNAKPEIRRSEGRVGRVWSRSFGYVKCYVKEDCSVVFFSGVLHPHLLGNRAGMDWIAGCPVASWQPGGQLRRGAEIRNPKSECRTATACRASAYAARVWSSGRACCQLRAS